MKFVCDTCSKELTPGDKSPAMYSDVSYAAQRVLAGVMLLLNPTMHIDAALQNAGTLYSDLARRHTELLTDPKYWFPDTGGKPQ